MAIAKSDDANCYSRNVLVIDDLASKEQLLAFLLLFIIFGIFHAPNLVNFLPAIDEEYAIFRDQNLTSLWVSQGRWGSFLLERFIMPLNIIPFLSTALFGILTSLGYLIYLRALGILRLDAIHFATFPIFSAFPTWYFATEFAANTPSMGFGVLFSCISAWYFQRLIDISMMIATSFFPRKLITPLMACSLAGAIAIGFYQSFAALLFALYLGVMLNLVVREAPAIISLGRMIGLALFSFAFSVLLYLVVFWGFLSVLGVQVSYIQGYYRLDKLLASPLSTIMDSALQGWRVYTGAQLVYGIFVPFLCIPLLLSLVGIGSVIARSRTNTSRFVIALIVLFLIAVPFGFNLMSGGSMPARALVAVPAVLWMIVTVGFDSAPKSLRRAWIIALPLLYFHMLSVMGMLYGARVLARIHDQLFAAALYERISNRIPNFSLNKTYKIDVFGRKKFDTVFPRGDSVASFSFFEWDGGNPYRMRDYMRIIGYSNLKHISVDERERYISTFQKMPSWPDEGSVLLEGDVILVKLSSEAGSFHSEIIRRQR